MVECKYAIKHTLHHLGKARIFTFGLILGFGEDEYLPHQIAKIVNERFGLKLKSKTISNWRSGLPVHMQRYGITDEDCREAVVRVLTGDLRKGEEIEELKPYIGIPRTPETPKDTPEAPEDASGRDGKGAREPYVAPGREGRRAQPPRDLMARAKD